MPQVAAVVLAAGRGRRYGDDSKLVASIAGMPLVRRVATTALQSHATPVVVVTGHAARDVASALEGLAVRIVHNADHSHGMSGSLAAGIDALPMETAGSLILLGDMPLVCPETLDRLIDTFLRAPASADAVVPVFEGRRGNPVLLGRSMFSRVADLAGDTGARALLADGHHNVLSCPVDDPGVELDVDTPDALQALNARA